MEPIFATIRFTRLIWFVLALAWTVVTMSTAVIANERLSVCEERVCARLTDYNECDKAGFDILENSKNQNDAIHINNKQIQLCISFTRDRGHEQCILRCLPVVATLKERPTNLSVCERSVCPVLTNPEQCHHNIRKEFDRGQISMIHDGEIEAMCDQLAKGRRGELDCEAQCQLVLYPLLNR